MEKGLRVTLPMILKKIYERIQDEKKRGVMSLINFINKKNSGFMVKFTEK